ncbi:hypothetical protein NMG60_11016276, partial [Bertholletia excelsa]
MADYEDVRGITLWHGKVIHALQFRSEDARGNTQVSKKFGGDGGLKKDIGLGSSEHITSIKTTSGEVGQVMVVKSLTIVTDKDTYGPFGDSSSGSKLTIEINNGNVVGFFGQAKDYITSLSSERSNSYYLNKLNVTGIHLSYLLCRSTMDAIALHACFSPRVFALSIFEETVGIPEGCVSLGPWGSKDGEPWSYIARGGVSQILVHHGYVIDSIVFQSQTGDGSLEYSDKFGGPAVCIDTPAEYLTAIHISYGVFSRHTVISSLRIQTNLAEYGPFGANRAGSVSSSSIPIESGEVVGFHGLSGNYLEALGIYIKPKSCISRPRPIKDWAAIQHQIVKMVVPRDPGPWGAALGKQWDDGVFSTVKQVRVLLASDVNVIRSVQIKYQKANGEVVWSPRHGGPRGGSTEVGGIDEIFVGIEGFYGPVGDKSGIQAVTLISFYTNRGLHGPLGVERGKYFSSA